MFTIEEFAVKVNRSVSGVRYWLNKGLLAKKKFAGRLEFSQEDVKIAEKIKEGN